MTPQDWLDAAVRAANEIDTEQPTLRASGLRENGRPVWITTVAARANANTELDRFGVKDAGPGRPISYDTIGIRAESAGFYAVSLCRDGEGYPRRVIDYGLVGPPQQWYAVPPEVPPDPPPPDPPDPPSDDWLAPLVAAVERIAFAEERIAAALEAALMRLPF